jgi:sigma-B regulation protein RsbU (phosphoserine phosphatase)
VNHPSDAPPDAAHSLPEAPLPERTLAGLEAENAALRGQVQALVRTEDQLHAVQTSLDTQLRIFRKLHDLGQRLPLLRKPRQILAELPDFVLYALGFQRSVAFLDEHGAPAMTATLWDGYYDPAQIEQISHATLRVDSPILERLHLGKKLLCASVDEAAPELAELGATLGFDQFLAIPLYGVRESPIGVLFAGNAGPDAALYTQASDRGEAFDGLASVAQLASAALHNCQLYAALLAERTKLEQKVADRTAELRAHLARAAHEGPEESWSISVRASHPDSMMSGPPSTVYGPPSGMMSGPGTIMPGPIEAESWENEPAEDRSGPIGGPGGDLAGAFQTDGSMVLIVDDAPDMRFFISRVLSKRYRVILACDGEEGLEKARTHHPDLIVSDVRMPRMDGHQLCQAIRHDPELHRTPLIMLSSQADPAQKIAGLEQGADDYLAKPFHAEELLTRVRNLIRLHHQERELLNAFRELEERDSLITDELTQAKEFQQSILPRPPLIEGLTIETLYEPLELVGGDLYDIEAVGPDRVRMLLCDATGHGMRAALTTMLIKSEYEFIKEPGAGPGALLAALNDRIANAYGRLDVRFTAACVDLDRAAGVLRYAVAAHPGPVLVHEGKARELAGEGAFLGLVPGITFDEHTTPFGPGDRLYLYTDGLTEEWSPGGEAFGEQRLMEALEEAATQGALGAPIVYDRVGRHIEQGHPHYDDLTLLGVWWGSPPGDEKETR